MRIDLVELLSTREIVNPSRIKKIVSHGDDQLELTIEGYGWWKKQNGERNLSEISFLFKGLLDGCINVTDFQSDNFEEDLDNFAVTWVEAYDNCEVFCSNPLGNPWNVFKLIHDAQVKSGMQPNPFQFLNTDHRPLFTAFEKIVSSRGYKLFSGPLALAEAIVPELKSQQVEFQLIKSVGCHGFHRVWFKDSQFTCREALAIFEDN